MKLITFLILNFIVSAVSDIVLNDLANNKGPKFIKSDIISSLKLYFQHKSIIVSSMYAGLTICFAVIMLSLISKQTLGYYVPSNFKQLLVYLFIAFIIGFLLDIAIDKLNIFGNSLHSYYKLAGAGLLGALAFIFSIVISYIIQKYLLPLLVKY